MKKLTQPALESLFERLDRAAGQLGKSNLTFTLIGSSVLIQEGMPYRATIDVDFWKVAGDDRETLGNMAKIAQINFDPNDYSNDDNPYLQIVWPGFVHMPVTDRWMDQSSLVWKGQFVEFRGAPVGVLLGSKLAAGREQDFKDIEYIVNRYPDWRLQLEQWIGDFSENHQEIIQENLIFAQMASTGKTTTMKNKP